MKVVEQSLNFEYLFVFLDDPVTLGPESTNERVSLGGNAESVQSVGAGSEESASRTMACTEDMTEDACVTPELPTVAEPTTTEDH